MSFHLLQFGDQEGLRGLSITLLELLKTKTGIIDASKGTGTGNTSLVYHAGKIMALHEGDLPYQVSVDLEARGGGGGAQRGQWAGCEGASGSGKGF